MEINESKKDGSIGKAIFGALGVLTGAGLIYTTYKLAQENNKLVNDYNVQIIAWAYDCLQELLYELI